MKLHFSTKETITAEDTIHFTDGQEVSQLVESAIDMAMDSMGLIHDVVSDIGGAIEATSYRVAHNQGSITLFTEAELADTEDIEDELSGLEASVSDLEAKLKALQAELQSED